MDKDIADTLDKLIATQNEILMELRKPPSRDLWDKLAPASVIVASFVAAIFTYCYNKTQLDVQKSRNAADIAVSQVQAVSNIIPHLSANDESRKVAALSLHQLGNDRFLAQLLEIDPSLAIVGDRVIATVQPITASRQEVAAETGWVFLGTYHSSTGKWETRYLNNLPDDRDPGQLKHATLTTVGPLNVRTGTPNDSGLLPPTKATLAAGARVRVVEVQKWQYNDYWFARVNY